MHFINIAHGKNPCNRFKWQITWSCSTRIALPADMPPPFRADAFVADADAEADTAPPPATTVAAPTPPSEPGPGAPAEPSSAATAAAVTVVGSIACGADDAEAGGEGSVCV